MLYASFRKFFTQFRYFFCWHLLVYFQPHWCFVQVVFFSYQYEHRFISAFILFRSNVMWSWSKDALKTNRLNDPLLSCSLRTMDGCILSRTVPIWLQDVLDNFLLLLVFKKFMFFCVYAPIYYDDECYRNWYKNRNLQFSNIF